MLEANSQTLTVTANTDITFANINIQTGITAVLDSDKATIKLNRPGIYRVDFTAYGSSTAAGAPQAIAFSTLVAVGRTMAGKTAKLNVKYTGAAGILNNADVVVTKIA